MCSRERWEMHGGVDRAKDTVTVVNGLYDAGTYQCAVQLENMDQDSQLLMTGADSIEQDRHGPARNLAFSSIDLKIDGSPLSHGYWQRWWDAVVENTER